MRYFFFFSFVCILTSSFRVLRLKFWPPPLSFSLTFLKIAWLANLERDDVGDGVERGETGCYWGGEGWGGGLGSGGGGSNEGLAPPRVEPPTRPAERAARGGLRPRGAGRRVGCAEYCVWGEAAVAAGSPSP